MAVTTDHSIGPLAVVPVLLTNATAPPMSGIARPSAGIAPRISATTQPKSETTTLDDATRPRKYQSSRLDRR